MQNILITGANRGIGLALVEQYLAQGNSRVYATCRDPEAASALKALAEANTDNLRVLQLDVHDEASIKRAVDAVSAETDSLDVLINNAGISGGDGAREMGQLNSAAVAAVITTNAVAPLIVTQACRELLKQADNPARCHDLVRPGFAGQGRRLLLRLPHEQSGDEYGGARPRL